MSKAKTRQMTTCRECGERFAEEPTNCSQCLKWDLCSGCSSTWDHICLPPSEH